jgi:hypothetical protein
MKQFILSATLLCSIFTTATAQNFLGKVPSGSSVVLKYAGENFSKSIPVKKIDSYNFIKQHFYKLLHADTMTSLENTGINFTQDTYQYVSMEDSSLSFVTLLHLKDAKQFLQLVKGSYKTGEAAKTERKNGFDLMAISPEIYIGWNETMAVIVNSSYKNKKNYYDYMYSSDTLVAVTAPVEVIKEEPVAVDTIAFTPPKIVKDKKPVTTKSKPTAKTKTKTAVKKPVAKKPVIIDEEVKEEETVVMAPAEEDNKYRIQDSINNLKRELWEQQQDMIAAKKQQAVAEAIINTAFNGTITSIENELSYKKIIDPAAHASIWLNTETLTKQYWNSFYMGRIFGMGRNNQFIKDTSNGYKSSVNIYFEKEVMRMEQKTFSEDANLTRLGNSIMNSKQNASLVKYVNPGNIGYFSMSVNTEAMANYYYTVVKNYISNMPYMNEYADIANVYIDLLEILIDEKGIADLMPGNALFVMHDMKSKWVTYTDYEYDKEFNYKEVKKTKKELSPDFTFVMETRKDAFMQKLANLPLKYAEKEHFNYKEKGGYYELVFDSGKYPISSLYFMIKEGKGIVTTSKEVVDMTLNNTGYTADADSKNSILNNNYSLKLNSKRLLETLKNEMSTDLSKKISTYLAENMGDVKMESSLKDGMIQGTTTMKTMGKHSNSLEFFFNMIESINDIMEKDRQEKEKIIN